MKLDAIYTDRHFQNWYSWHLIYEWEDILSEHLNLPLINSTKASAVTKYLGKACNFSSATLSIPDSVLFPLFSVMDKFTYKRKALYIELDVKRKFYFAASRNTVPIIVDFWKNLDLTSFYNTYKNCKAVLISHLEAYNYVKENNCPLRVYHFPLSLSDKYRLLPTDTFKKKYDIIMPGRINKVLWHYLQDYLQKHPDTEYLYQVDIDRKVHYYSNKTGDIGMFQERAEYMDLLKSARVSFYATPGIDDGESRTGGFNPVTPRFLEMIAAGCKVIARYPKNEETDFFEMDTIAPSADTYEIFEQELNKALTDNQQPIVKNATYLQKHYTSARARLLQDILKGI